MQTTLFLIQDTVLTPTTINTITCETRALLTDEKRSESGESQFGQENHSTIIFVVQITYWNCALIIRPLYI